MKLRFLETHKGNEIHISCTNGASPDEIGYFLRIELKDGLYPSDYLPSIIKHISNGKIGIETKINNKNFDFGNFTEYFYDLILDKNVVWAYFGDKLLEYCDFKDISCLQNHLNTQTKNINTTYKNLGYDEPIVRIDTGYCGE